MFVIPDNKHHTLSPNATLRTTGGPARKPGSAVNTARASVQPRKLATVLLTAAGIVLLKTMAKTRNGRRALVNLAYRQAYRRARDTGASVNLARRRAIKASGRVAGMLKRRGVYLKQVQAYSNAHRLGTRFDRSNPVDKLYTMDSAEFNSVYSYHAITPSRPDSVARPVNAPAIGKVTLPEYTVPVYDKTTGAIVVEAFSVDTSHKGEQVL